MLLENVSRKLAARPVPSGWALDLILRLDEANSGFLRFLHTASNLRRQCVYFALTQLDWDRPEAFAGWIKRARETTEHKEDAPSSVIASGLMSMRVRDGDENLRQRQVIHDTQFSSPRCCCAHHRVTVDRCYPSQRAAEIGLSLRLSVEDGMKMRPRAA